MKTIFDNIQKDKLLHSYVSDTLFVVLFGIIFLFLNLPIWLTYTITTVVVFAIGIIKELIDDKEKGNRFDWKDIIADVSGIVFGGLECLLFVL